MENLKLNKMTLKKQNLLNHSPFANNQKGHYFILPMIDKNIINSAYNESTSVLSKYISTQANSFYKEARKHKNSFLNYTKKNEISPKKALKTEENASKVHQNFYLTAQDSNINNNISSELSKDNQIEENKIHLTEENTIKKERPRKIDSDMSIDKILNKNQFKIVNSTFHRLRTYHPKIEKNWKLSNGVSIVNNKTSLTVPYDAEYQSKIFHDQYKLLVDNYHYYKMKIVANDDFNEAFKSLNLKTKIEFNKNLEEICGLLILLPRHILAEFFKYIEYLKAPSKSSLKDKYIFDEVSCLYYNNKLLAEIFEYFKNSFDIYLLLVKEVNGMVLKHNEFDMALSTFERIRFDLGLICNISENALINYAKEIGVIYKLKRFESEQNKINNIEYTKKLKNYKSLSKTKERQKKLRIDEILTDYNLDLNKSKEKGKFFSIINSKFITKLIGHCRKDVKYNIITERLNNEFDYNTNKPEKVKNKPIKMNF